LYDTYEINLTTICFSDVPRHPATKLCPKLLNNLDYMKLLLKVTKDPTNQLRLDTEIIDLIIETNNDNDDYDNYF